ncbi:Hsp20/alpha crystallin family protein [Halopelagius longus]|uniref:Heat shock protein Hsp20 n=1 Tax=Halopelagius longus TaxID=1236180 RepID=A0A1H1DUX8_9EURY|nr:Hsp20/alpha crystallin family protein [Halopelagius longus]RDI71480.1 Hsp20/alpha crystallin family protein [Halopelagius longus]SDQ80321.1 heat shock protein Hsp20 [Halopelagius longus]
MAQSNPFEDVEKLLERLNGEFEANVGRREVDVDVADRGDEFVVVADLPGYEKADIDVSLADRRLTVSTERTAVHDASDAQFLRQERTREAVSRSVTLPNAVVATEATATYENGVLTVTLPKASPTPGDEGTEIEVE